MLAIGTLSFVYSSARPSIYAISLRAASEERLDWGKKRS
jgi:hypothetical protein